VSLIDALDLALRLTTEEQRRLVGILDDLPGIQEALDYLHNRPAILKQDNDDQRQLRRSLLSRWKSQEAVDLVLSLRASAPTSDTPTQATPKPKPRSSTSRRKKPSAPAASAAVLEPADDTAAPSTPPPSLSVATPPSAAINEPTESEKEAARTKAAARAHLNALINGKWRVPEIARQLQDNGVTITRGELSRFIDDRGFLSTAVQELILTLPEDPSAPPKERITPEEIMLYCEELGLDATALMHRVDDMFLNAPSDNPSLMETVRSLGITEIEALLDGRWSDKQITREQTNLMSLRDGLAELLTVHDLHKELKRASSLGWDTETLTPEVRRLGWEGPALEHFTSTDPEEIKALTNVIKNITEPYTPPLESLPKPPDPDVNLVLTSTAERKAYVESILDRDGMVSGNSLSPIFKIHGAAVSNFLRRTMQLEPFGNGRYRRAK